MKRLLWLTPLSMLLVACGGEIPTADPASSTPSATSYSNLAQLMRAVPFPHSNTIFDTQDRDPESRRKPGDPNAGATATYGDLYGGWEGVENAALMLSETANLIMIPGRLCENGLPVPVEREDFRKAAEGLAVAGRNAYKVAQARDLGAMIEVSNQVAEACAACHDVYRDKPEGQQRCIP